MNTERTYYEIFFKDDSNHIVYVEEKTVYVTLSHLQESLIHEKQSLLEIQICVNGGYTNLIVPKVHVKL